MVGPINPRVNKRFWPRMGVGAPDCQAGNRMTDRWPLTQGANEAPVGVASITVPKRKIELTVDTGIFPVLLYTQRSERGDQQ